MKRIKTKRHSTFSLTAHIVFVTKYRKSVLHESQLDFLEELFRDALIKNDCELVEFNGEKDHVHLLIDFEPKHSLSDIINILKGRSSRMLKKEFPDLAFNLGGKSALWTRSYFVGTVGGATIEKLKDYIENQNRPNY